MVCTYSSTCCIDHIDRNKNPTPCKASYLFKIAVRPYLNHQHDTHYFQCCGHVLNLIAMRFNLGRIYLSTCYIKRINQNKNLTLLKASFKFKLPRGFILTSVTTLFPMRRSYFLIQSQLNLACSYLSTCSIVIKSH